MELFSNNLPNALFESLKFSDSKSEKIFKDKVKT